MSEKGKQHAMDGNMKSVARPTHAEGVKTLLHAQNMGTLSTHSSHHDGYPFGSMMPYALDSLDRPLVLISSMAVHTQNILHNSKASLYVAESRAEGESLGTARLTLMGDLQLVRDSDVDAVRECYLSAHPNARHWVDYDDFSFYRMDVAHVYFVGGFGIMGWVNELEYSAAVPDPLMHIAAEVIQHMNDNHADALITLVNHHSDRGADEVRMVGVDRLGFDVKVSVADAVRGLRIAFTEPVHNALEVRTMFVSMLHDARGQTNA
ncbi:DUF2470 domain-containing protein [Mariprofundus ferrooxydans]|nr:DUF2470 domain-containing protein [Mariprofundus ferrooxydans]